MKSSLAALAAYSISLWIGFPSTTPVRAWGSLINPELWLYITVSRLATPGRILFLPPEKPAKKCGSIKPSATNRSASAARRLMIRLPPDGSLPRYTRLSLSSQSWTTIFSFAMISGPNFAASSSLVVVLWRPVEIRMVISASGLPLRISAKIRGIMMWLGTGLVWSEEITTTFFFPTAISHSLGVPIGCSKASWTSSAPLFGAL